jgi:hypothetical protein
MRTLDFSKGRALHNLYGHSVFLMEAQKAGKDARFTENVCFNLQCTGQANDWRSNLPTHI